MSIPASKRSIEMRLQGWIESDRNVNKQIAIKTKVVNMELQQFGKAIETNQLEYYAKMKEFQRSEREVNELKEIRDEMQTKIDNLKQQIQRAKKKNAEPTRTTCKFADADRKIYEKKELKMRILTEATRTHFVGNKSLHRLRGYVTKGDDCIPFEAASAADVWQKIEESSEFTNEWKELML